MARWIRLVCLLGLTSAACGTSDDSGGDDGSDGAGSDDGDASGSDGSMGDDGGSESGTGGGGTGDGSTATGGGTGTGTGSAACDMPEYSDVASCAEIVGEWFCSDCDGPCMHQDQDADIEWTNNPPHSGQHYPTWEAWGEHDATVPRGNWVHNLEHGSVVLAYLCPGGCDAELDVLRQVVADRPDSRVLLTPDPELEAPGFAAVSWQWVYTTDTPDLDTLLCFVDQHFNHAPEDVP